VKKEKKKQKNRNMLQKRYFSNLTFYNEKKYIWIFSEMVSKQDAAFFLPNLKIAKMYFANVSLIIFCSITIKAPALDY